MLKHLSPEEVTLIEEVRQQVQQDLVERFQDAGFSPEETYRLVQQVPLSEFARRSAHLLRFRGAEFLAEQTFSLSEKLVLLEQGNG